MNLKNGIETLMVEANKYPEKFFGANRNSEEADDVLFALQAYYGNPKLDYEEAENKYTPEEVEKAVNYVKKKGYNKFTYFSEPKHDIDFTGYSNGDWYLDGGKIRHDD